MPRRSEVPELGHACPRFCIYTQSTALRGFVSPSRGGIAVATAVAAPGPGAGATLTASSHPEPAACTKAELNWKNTHNDLLWNVV